MGQGVHDIINGVFEFSGAIFIFPSILSVLRDKRVNGINWLTQLFFTSWSLWNLVFYPHFNHWASFYGAIALSLCQLTWLSLLIYYTYRPAPMDSK